jgi:hypothetical protein
MRNIIFAMLLLLPLACHQHQEPSELHLLIEDFVTALEDADKSFKILGMKAEAKLTGDGRHQVTAVGRLVNVKIMAPVPAEEYEALREQVAGWYEGDSRVREVYISGHGTVMLDCRK